MINDPIPLKNIEGRSITLDPAKLPSSARDLYIGCYIGYLKLIKRVRTNPKASPSTRKKWRVKCTAPSCGKELTVSQSYLVRRPTPKTDCGCVIENNKSLQAIQKREYRIWTMMNVRCTDPRHCAYYLYGGRGIKIHKEWQKGQPEAFEKWFAYMGPAPTLTHTMDRIDPDGNYEPGNLRWATPKEQALNTRKQKYARLAKEQAKIKTNQ